MRIILVLILCLLTTGCKEKSSELVYHNYNSICGDGYTDKNGITWDSVNDIWHFNKCCFKPRLCEKCLSNGDLEKPTDDKICIENNYDYEELIVIKEGTKAIQENNPLVRGCVEYLREKEAYGIYGDLSRWEYCAWMQKRQENK